MTEEYQYLMRKQWRPYGDLDMLGLNERKMR